MNPPSSAGFKVPPAIAFMLAASIDLPVIALAKVAKEPTGISNSIGAGGSIVINAIKGDVLPVRISATNPSGPPPEISDFTLLVDDVPKPTASFTKIAEGAFVMNWTAELPSTYPDKLVQNLAVCYTISQKTIIIPLGRVDVAEWEGMIAILPSGQRSSGWNARVDSHVDGAKSSTSLLSGGISGSSLWYRGPKQIPLSNFKDGTTMVVAQIAAGMRYPLLFISQSKSGALAIVKTLDISDPKSYGHDRLLVINNYSTDVRMVLDPSGGISAPPLDTKYLAMPAELEAGPHLSAIAYYRNQNGADILVSSSTIALR